jgi:hypothetical protein
MNGSLFRVSNFRKNSTGSRTNGLATDEQRWVTSKGQLAVLLFDDLQLQQLRSSGEADSRSAAQKISELRHKTKVAFFLLGDSPASEFYVPTFRNTICPIFIGRVHTTYEDGTGCS